MTISLAELTTRASRVAQELAAKKAAEREAKATAKRPPTREELELRALAEWRPAALVLVVEHWKCACGIEGLSPGGLMLLQEHVRMANSRRLVSPRFASEVPEGLPRRRMIPERIVALCPSCAGAQGFVAEYTEPRMNGAGLADFKGEGAGFVAEWQRLIATPEEVEDGPDAMDCNNEGEEDA